MKRITLMVLGLAASFSPNAASAQTASADDGFYASGYLGGQYVVDSDISNNVGGDEIEWDLGYRFGGAVGYRTGRFRVEGELGYRVSEGDVTLQNGFVFVAGADEDVELSILQGSVNGFYDIADLLMGPIPFTPYIGAGLGFARAEIDSNALGDDDETGPVLLFEGGMAIDASPSLAFVPAYRFDIVGIEVGEDDTI
ncbi:MAG: outer membrane protein, partial [Geminicoccaceae bacterium]